MLWINWIPEILIVVLLLASLFLLSIRRGAVPGTFAGMGVLSLLALAYFWLRDEGFSNQSPYSVFILDSLSYFGRSIGLLWLGFGSIYLAFHERINLKNKLKIMPLFIFFCGFTGTLFSSSQIIMYLLCWVGGVVTLHLISVLESENLKVKTAVLRQSVLMLFAVVVLGLLFFFFKKSTEMVLLLGWALSFAFPLNLIQIQTFTMSAPLSRAWWSLFVFFSGSMFWLRFGLPLMGESKWVWGLMFTITALHSALVAVRSKDSVIWLGAVLFAFINLGWLSLVLEPESAISLFYGFGVVGVPLFCFAGFAYYQENLILERRLKIILALALVAFMPFVTSNLYFGLVSALAQSGLFVFALLGMCVWLLLCISAIQQIGNLTVTKTRQIVDGPAVSGASLLLLFLFLSCVILLAFLKEPLLQLLNHHPIS